ncbi:MAG: hypothetical protein SNJ70_10125 [Armatimonadota bacterium]
MTKYIYSFLIFSILSLNAITILADTDTKPKNKVSNEHHYVVNMAYQGKVKLPLNDNLVDINTSRELVIRHITNQMADDKSVMVELNVISGHQMLGEDKLLIDPRIYPKLTAILTNDNNLKELYGTQKPDPNEMPAINYSNMIILFILPDYNQDKQVGDTWDYEIKIPSMEQTFKFANTISKDDSKTITIKQNINQILQNSNSSLTAESESIFDKASRRLLSTTVDCNVSRKLTGKDEGKEEKINIKITITEAK